MNSQQAAPHHTIIWVWSFEGNLVAYRQKVSLQAGVSVRFKPAPFVAVLVLAFVYVSLFYHRIPISIQSVLFFVIVFIEVVLIAAGWWYCFRNPEATGIAKWRQRMALIAVLANTTAFLIPFGAFLYGVFYLSTRLRFYLPMVDGEKMILAGLVSSLSGVIAGLLAPPRSRFATSLGSLIIALLILAIPIGIL